MTVVLKYYGNAHTDSDIFAHFTDADILQTDDTFWNGSYPFIDYSTGGSIDGKYGRRKGTSSERPTRPSSFPGMDQSAEKLISQYSAMC